MQDGFKVAETLLVKTKKLSGRPALLLKAEIETVKEPKQRLDDLSTCCASITESVFAFLEHA